MSLIGWIALPRPSNKAALQPPIRLTVDLGPEASLNNDRGQHSFSISPDGARIAFACASGDGETRICTRRLDQTQSVVLAGTEGVQTIFLSPDGRWIGFTASGKLRKVSDEGGAPSTLCNAGGRLVYMHQDTLFAARMDVDRLALTSEPVTVIDDVSSRPLDGGADFDFSQSGMFVYLSSRFSGRTTVQWLHRSGKLEPLMRQTGAYDWIRLSPDGSRLALIENAASRDVWVYDPERKTMSRITSGASTIRL